MIKKKDLIEFETLVKNLYENKKIKAPIHLSSNNEEQLIRIFKNIKKKDWVFSTWRSHYHAILHGIKKKEILKQILNGKSMSICSNKPKFYSSSIVGGTLPIALGVAMANKIKRRKECVWVFIGDMTYETGVFHECHKYSELNNLNIKYIVEDNNMSTNTPTDKVWKIKTKAMKNVYKYVYKRKYPHHGTGSWILF
jgi:TPP-dependent pyruvate/acetoin dehydrogenase alpha subunit